MPSDEFGEIRGAGFGDLVPGNGAALRAKRERRKAARGPGTVWGSRFNRKPRSERRRLIQQPWLYPMAAQNLAAIVIQSLARGHQRRERAAGGGRGGRGGRGDDEAKAAETMLAKFLASRAAKMASGLDADAYEDWKLTRVQAWWRMLMVKSEYDRNRHSMYHIAAMQVQYMWRAHQRHQFAELSGPQPRINAALSIQRAWRRWTNLRIFRYYRDLIKFRNTGDPRVMLRSINPREASLIDAASQIRVRFRLGGTTFPPTIYYKMFTNAPLCDVNSFAPRDYTRVKGVAAANRHNRAEAPPLGGHGPDDSRILEGALDAGTGAVIRVGRSVYAARMSTTASSSVRADLAATGGRGADRRRKKGAYSEMSAGFGVSTDGRTVTATALGEESKYGEAGAGGWYARRENNGWRPVSLKSLEDADKDPVAAATAKLAQEFHYSKLKRSEDVRVRRKRKKQKWLKRMYAEGLARERGVPEGEGKKGGDVEDLIDFEGDGWEEDAAELLQWSSALDFDAYIDDWGAVGTSGKTGALNVDLGDEVIDDLGDDYDDDDVGY